MSERKKRNYFGIPRAMGLPFLKAFNKSIAITARQLLHPSKSTHQETFEEAIARLQLTEEDINHRMQQFLYLAIGFAVFALLVFIYTVYLFWHGHLLAGILGIAVTLMILTQVFRYHFWHFQMKRRKLGCTFKEWLQS